jgi:hypothetical protein
MFRRRVSRVSVISAAAIIECSAEVKMKIIKIVALAALAISSTALLIIGVADAIVGRPYFESMALGMLGAILFRISLPEN